MDKNHIFDNLKQIDEKLDSIIKNINYAKVHHKSTVVITNCGNAAFSLKDIQKKLTEIATGLEKEEKQLSENISKSANNVNGAIENVNYAKVHYKTTAVITSCESAVKKLKEIREELAEIVSKLGVSNNKETENEREF